MGLIIIKSRANFRSISIRKEKNFFRFWVLLENQLNDETYAYVDPGKYYLDFNVDSENIATEVDN